MMQKIGSISSGSFKNYSLLHLNVTFIFRVNRASITCQIIFFTEKFHSRKMGWTKSFLIFAGLTHAFSMRHLFMNPFLKGSELSEKNYINFIGGNCDLKKLKNSEIRVHSGQMIP